MQPPLPFALHQRKIDLSKNVSVMDGWHHEVIPRSRPNLRILAATVSSQSSFNAASRSSILDRTPPPLAKLQRDFEFATRAVSKMLYSSHAAPSVLKSSAYLSSSEFIKVASETVAVRRLFSIYHWFPVFNPRTQITPRASAYTAPPSALLDSIASLMSAGSGQSCDPFRMQLHPTLLSQVKCPSKHCGSTAQQLTTPVSSRQCKCFKRRQHMSSSPCLR